MYATITAAATFLVMLLVTSIAISPAPAQETASIYTNIPPMYEVNWGSDEPLSPEADHALHTFYVCEYSPRGQAALKELRDAIGKMSFDDDSNRIQRADDLYGLAKQHEREGVCRWSDHQQEYFLYGYYHSTDEYDLSEVPCTSLPNGICAYIQPMKNALKEDEMEMVYSLFTDTDDDIVRQEIFGGEQWALIN